MIARLTVLASGSAGNATLLEADGFGLLLDAGLGPRQLARRLALVDRSWRSIHAVVLTHTHTDHWKESTFAQLLRLQIPLYCHADHVRRLRLWSLVFADLLRADLVRLFEAETLWPLSSGLMCRALTLRHDGGATFGFRFECATNGEKEACALAYAADLGTWDTDLAQALSDVDVLALEFNHDIALQRASDRPPQLIARILSDEGHLSNDQAARLLHAVLDRSPPGRLRHLIQLHLSRDCNHPALAAAAAQNVLTNVRSALRVHTAHQDQPLPGIDLAYQRSFDWLKSIRILPLTCE